MQIPLGFAEVCLCDLSCLTFPCSGKASSHGGDAASGRWDDGESKSPEQEHHKYWDAPGGGGEGGGLLVQSCYPHGYIGKHSKVSVFSTNRPCNLHEGIKFPQEQHMPLSKVPISATDVIKDTCFLPVQLHHYFQT